VIQALEESRWSAATQSVYRRGILRVDQLEVLAALDGWRGYAAHTGELHALGRDELVPPRDQQQAQGGAEVFIGKGNGTFQPPISYSTGMFSVAVAVGDFNIDARPDINNFSSTVSVLAAHGDGVFKTSVPFGTLIKCFYGAEDKASIGRMLNPSLVESYELPGGHRVGKRFEFIAEKILETTR